MDSVTINRLRARLNDARRLVEIHGECTGPGRGRRHGYDALNRSAIILSVAAWEGFVEDLLSAAVASIARNASGPSRLPQNVRDAMIASLHQQGGWGTLNEKTKNGIWALAGRGWRNVYLHYSKEKVSALNTPDYEKTKKLYSSVVGLADFARRWKTRRWQAKKYISELEKLLRLRHRIAHGAIGAETVGKDKAKAAIKLIENLAIWTEGEMEAHLKTLKIHPIRRLRLPKKT